jgi:hypothetical protein
MVVIVMSEPKPGMDEGSAMPLPHTALDWFPRMPCAIKPTVDIKVYVVE